MLSQRKFWFHEKPPIVTTLLVSLQHLLAVTGGIITAPLIIAMGMGLSLQDTSYMVSSSLVISGLATLIQINRIGSIGSGLLSIQGTSFTFIGPLIFAYSTLVQSNSAEQTLAIIFGCCAACSLVVMALSQFIVKLKRVITTNVSGTTVILIGVSLVWTSVQNLMREYQQVAADGGQAWLVLALALVVLAVTFALSLSKHPILKITSITTGLVLGLVAAWFLGMVDLSSLDSLDHFFYPTFLHFSLGFDFSIFFLLMPIFIISSSETVGDLTATAKLSNLTLGDSGYWQRIKGGVSGDAFNSFFAAIFSTFPNTSFSQNNGVIRLTGISSPYVGMYTAVALCILGVFPVVGGLFILMPGAVLYGATLLMFIMVFISGISIVNSATDEDRNWGLVFTAVTSGLLLAFSVPHVDFIPPWLATFLTFPVSTGATIALIIEVIKLRRNRPVTSQSTA